MSIENRSYKLTTHELLMERSYERLCDVCLVPWTVEHFSVECPNFIEERHQCFQYRNPDMTQVLSHENPFRVDKVMIFPNKINLINEIWLSLEC